jgi:hypothetical protein
MVLAGLVTAFAAAPADAQQSLEDCAKVPTPAVRLACYDQLALPSQVPTSPPSPAQSSVQTFGAETLPSTSPSASSRINRIVSSIQAYTFSPTGHFTVTLANGQVWRQMEGDNGIMRFRRGRTLLATISRGAFGSFDLKFSDHSVIYKVTRVR